MYDANDCLYKVNILVSDGFQYCEKHFCVRPKEA